MGKLNQIIAVEKSVKSQAHGKFSDLYKIIQKEDLFNGMVKTYAKKDDSGDDLPQEKKKVQFTVTEMLRKAQLSVDELLTVTARKDWTNCTAKGSVTVDGKVIIKDAPISFLLFLEKTLTEVRTFVIALPTLDNTEVWTKDTNSGMYVSAPITTHRTHKAQMPIVLYDATAEHPAQTQLITKDILVGHWQQIKQSGAVPATEKDQLVERVDKILRATKEAREEANTQDEVKIPDIGESVFGYIFGA